MDAEVVAPFMFFAFLAAVILVPIWLKERTRQSAHQLLAQALEKGQTLDPAVLRQLTEGKAAPQQDRPRRTLGSGVVLLALSIGFLAANFLDGDFGGGGMLIAATILGALGIAFILLAIVDYSAKKRDL